MLELVDWSRTLTLTPRLNFIVYTTTDAIFSRQFLRNAMTSFGVGLQYGD